MRFGILASILVLSAGAAHAASAPKPAPIDPKSILEGEWHGVTVDTNANKLCTKDAPPSTVLSFEFQRSGGVAFFNNGVQEESGRRRVTEARVVDGLMQVTLDRQIAPFVFRQDGPDRLALVRESASLGMPVDVMVFKRCKAAADRSQILVDQTDLVRLAAEMPGDFPYFVDVRIAAKIKNACNAPQVQYLFFGLVGPAEFRVSRWNSFDLGDALTSGKKPAFPIDAIGDWAVLSASSKDGVVTLQARDYEKPDAAPITLTLQLREGGRLAIPEWGREYVRCTGFDNRS